MRRARRLALPLLCALLSSLVDFSVLLAQSDDNALETALANAYLYLASRTTWPATMQNQSSFVFCINRDHELYEAFTKLLPTKKLQGLPVEQRSFEAANLDAQKQCNLIALSTDETLNRKIVAHAKGLPILTISHEVDITAYGGLIYLAHDRRLEPPKIDFEALESSRLKVDATVLDLSRKRWGGE